MSFAVGVFCLIWYTYFIPMKNVFRHFFGICVVVILLLLEQPVFGASEVDRLHDLIQDRKSDISELEDRIAAYKKQIAQKQKEISSLRGELEIIRNRVARVELEIESTEIEIEASEQQLRLLQLGIEDKEQSIAEHKEWVSSLLRAIRRLEQQDVLTVMMSDDSLGAFLRSKQQLSDMQGHIDSSLRQLAQVKIQLEAQRADEQKNNERLTDLHETLAFKQEELQNEVDRKTFLIAETKSSEQKYTTLVEDLKREAAQIESEISSLERSVREKLEREGKLGNAGPFDLMWPVPSRYVTATYHDPGYPFRHIFEHPGTDIRASQGTPLHAAAGGYVGRARDNGMGYSYIMLIHQQGFATLYGHVSAIYVKQGQYVEQGEVIGLSGGKPGTPGAGPFVTGPHLHFEVRKDGVPVNAEFYLP